MRVGNTTNSEKPHGIFTENGNLVKDFYSREDALSYLDHIKKFPAVVERVEAKNG